MKSLDNYKPHLFWTALVLFTIPVTIRLINDVDIWWHMQIGRSILENMAPPDLTTFYWSPLAPDYPRDIRFTWLGDVLFHLLYSIGGAPALHLLVLASVLGCCLMVHRLVGPQYSLERLLLFFFLVAGSYQLQILRNALFGLPCAMLVCLLWWRARDKAVCLFWVPPVLGLWSCLHGSYLLGFGLFALLAVGDLLDRLRQEQAGIRSFALCYTGSLVLGFLLISLFNPFTLQVTQRILSLFSVSWILLAVVLLLAISGGIFLIRLPFEKRRRILNHALPVILLVGGTILTVRHFQPFFAGPDVLKPMNLRAYHTELDLAGLGFWERIKHGLNNTFWSNFRGDLNSIDFLSPFDFLSDLHVWSSLLLLVPALVSLARHRKRYALILPFLAVTCLGLGYVRTIGFIAVFSVFLIAVQNVRERLDLPSQASTILAESP